MTGAGSQTWGGWTWEAFKEWPQFFALAIPGMLMTAAEAWAFEAMVWVRVPRRAWQRTFWTTSRGFPVVGWV